MQTRCGIYLWGANMDWYIHGITCDNQRYPWYISEHWYIPGISLVYAKSRKLINGVKIPDGVAPDAVWLLTAARVSVWLRFG